MPPDIATRWNSTYDMLSFSVKYRKVIEVMTSEWKNELCQFELEEEEWAIAEELGNILMVRVCDVL